MKSYSKKIVAFFLALALLLGAVPLAGVELQEEISHPLFMLCKQYP